MGPDSLTNLRTESPTAVAPLTLSLLAEFQFALDRIRATKGSKAGGTSACL